ncbi:patatin-like phospholipase family protein [Ancylothrix sp. C2]|uniref:patatin-like phospholipase family protein n=1 Tax=Ancylothrix sp. D3o TaxID=2953691 RepID=UPI0021BA753A|nr:patatin-like phospholipase family protein [Ancylothrix sp. D3o]MCT7951168.1 patatin-like phospholipase family protein [Ancylothrix sp. D3o]
MAERKFRILALDGGGIRGVITAKILERVQEKIGKPLNEYFDLIAGTSTGSILAAGLVLGIPPEELIKIYRDRGKEIFSSSFFRQKFSYWLNQPKYSNDGLKKILKDYFGEILLENLREESKIWSKQHFPNSNPNPKARLLILAYSTSQRYTSFFLSPFVDENPWYKGAKLWEVCLVSASAPTFFPPYKFNLSQDFSANFSTDGPAEYTFVDGGVAANNPSLAALVHTLDIEKIDGQKIKLEDIALLSIGTGRTTEPLEFEKVNSWGALGWASHIPDVFMGGQFQITADLCAQLICSVNPNGYLRLQFPLNKQYKLKEGGKTVRLPKDEQVNAYTNEYLDEAMDRADVPHLDNLIKTATAYLNYPKEDYCTFDGVKCSIDKSIEKFIEVNR